MDEGEIAVLLAETEQILAELHLEFIVAQERVLAAEGLSKSASEVAERTFDQHFSDDLFAEAAYPGDASYDPRPRSTGRPRYKFVGLEADLSAKFSFFAATITNPSVVHLLEGRKKRYEVGVLPGRKAERDIQERFAQALRSYRQSR